jgi:SAM-dependent methyltransferase
MPVEQPVAQRYLGSDYVTKNPTWDSEDSPWKAGQVRSILEANGIQPTSFVDVGCGAGLVLAQLQKSYPSAKFTGYDIAPDAERFWEFPRSTGIVLTIGDITAIEVGPFDVLLALDVIEHLADPYSFLERVKTRATHFVFHFPLDLSAMSVLREQPLLKVHDQVGHLHFFTRRLALALLLDCGYQVIDARYTGASFSAPRRGLSARLARLPRRLVSLVSRDWGARLLGGETLMVLATV